MAETFEVNSINELVSLIQKHAKQREDKVKKALRATAAKGRGVIKTNVPVAFGELRESVHTEDTSIVVDAPHAAAVNNGSRPHLVPLEPLIAWVRLRGAQGLATKRQQTRLPGTSTKAAARRIASEFRKLERSGSLDVDAAVQVAKAIQARIAKYGTRPTFFLEKSLPEIHRILDEELGSIDR